MATVSLRKIKSVEPQQNFRLKLVWDGGSPVVVDFSSVIRAGGVFSELKDVDFFNKVRIGERKRTIEWPNLIDDLESPIIDLDAESLAAMAEEQNQRSTY